MRNRSTRRADLGVSILLVLLCSGYVLGQFERAREVADRVKCQSNLRQIGQAMLLYANDNKGMYPKTIWTTDNPKPTWGTPYRDNPKLGAEKQTADPFDTKNSKVVPASNDVTAAIFLLLRTQDITSEVFTCPSSGQSKWDFGGGTNAPINWTNWAGVESLREHLSYSMNNPYVAHGAIGKGWKWNNTLGAEYAVAADMNPGNDALLKINVNSPAKDMMAGNSINHDRDGENILYGDGHVAFESNPFVGVMRDNIYTFGDSGSDHPKTGGDGIVGACVGPNDSVMLPTSVELGVIDKEGRLTAAGTALMAKHAGGQPPSDKELAAAVGKVVGTYTRDGGATLTIAKDKLTLNGGAGGKTVAYNLGMPDLTADGGGVRLNVSTPGSLQGATVTVWLDGKTLFVAGDPQLAGKWTKE